MPKCVTVQIPIFVNVMTLISCLFYFCRPNDSVQISLAGKTIDVRTHVFKQRGKKYLGSAYPDL